MKTLSFAVIILILLQLGCNQPIKENENTTMKKPFLGLRTTIYLVNDLEKAKAWYAEAFETQPYFDEPFYVGFNIGGYELGLLPDTTASADKTPTVLSYWLLGSRRN